MHAPWETKLMPSSAGRWQSIADSLTERFLRTYGERPKIFRAPGRVNLIGEHTDYNDGFVMPAAIDFHTWIAASPRKDCRLQVHSEQFSETIELSLDALAGPPRKHWSDFIRGVAATLESSGHKLQGANLIIHGDVPIGAGLSSSASLEIATAFALLSTSGLELPPLEVVNICQRAEHEYAGTRCGVMDQFIAMFGRSGQALLLDCRSLKHKLLPIPTGVRLAICNTMVKHDLAASEYNRRRADCESGMRILRQHLPRLLALRDVRLADLEKYRNELPELVYRRCRHVIRENQRVLDASDALQSGDLDRFGQLMYESHHSLRHDYDVSCSELDLLVELASACEGVYGARMTGGGFGGCTVNLVGSDAVDRFRDQIKEAYLKTTGKAADLYVCSAAEGAGPW
jgi:galactokinase